VGTKERRQREVAEREALFLDVALELVREESLLNLQMSRIAEKAEYAVGTLYLHFSSKEDLLLALVTRTVKDYYDLTRKASEWKAPSRDRMFAVGVGDLVFVKKHPDYFRIVQYILCEVAWNAASEQRKQAFHDANRPGLNLVSTIVEDARRSGDLEIDGQTAEELALGVWAICSGYHNFTHAEGLLNHLSITEPYFLMCRHLQNLLDGYHWKPIAGPAEPQAISALIERIKKEVFPEDLCNAA
tara:strand:- start:2125 stop:2856 length:732 start_codon:yes stop_codon:yes gene_type:complete